MRLGGRLSAAIEIIQDMETRHRPAADAMRDWGLSHRFAGSGDRAAIGNLVYDALRRRRSAAWLFDADTPRASVLGAYFLETSTTPDALAAELEGDNFAPAPLDSGETATVTQRLAQQMPQAERANFPLWCEESLIASFGESWAEEGEVLSARPPLDMRVNTLKASKEKVLKALAHTHAASSPIAPHGVRVPPISGNGRHPNVQAEPAYRKGWFEVQDEGSQIVAELAAADAGKQVLDFCAGAGGKTLALSARMENRGQIFAFDADKQRLAPIFDRLKRAGSRNVQVVSRLEGLEPQRGQMDLVLVDAPCTGSGTWRRRPDAKWRLTRQQLEARMAEQAAILDDAASYVRPGGRLVYITCSVFREENEDQADAFLKRNAAFSRQDHLALWKRCFEASAPAHLTAEGLVLTPATSGTDGFHLTSFKRD